MSKQQGVFMRLERLTVIVLALIWVVGSAPALAETDVKTIRYAAHNAEKLRNADEHVKFMRMLDDTATLPFEVLNSIAFEVRDIAFYRIGDRQNKKFPRHLYESLEQKLMQKFVDVRRFAVHECFECKTTRVLLREKQFQVLRQLDSNESLADVGKKIGVDHFVLWDAYMHKNEPILNMRIVSADGGVVRWSQQYRGEQQRDMSWEFYTSVWGTTAVREPTGSEPQLTVSPLVAMGIRRLSRSTISKRIFYGYGGEVFLNTTGRSNIDVLGFDLNGRIAIELDPSLGIETKDYGNWLIYTSLAQAFVYTTPTIILRTGIEMRLNKSSFIDVGTITFRDDPFDVKNKSGYMGSATLAGTSYDITIGYRF